MSTSTQLELDRSLAEPVEAPGETPSTRPRPAIRELGLLAALTALVSGVLLQPLPLDRPVLYGGDTFLHMALARSSDWMGNLGSTVRLGAPHGIDWSAYPASERLHLVLLHALDEVTGSLVAAVNLHVWSMVVITALVSFAVLRWLRVLPIPAGAAALVFALSPSALQRLAPGHLFLFALFPVALGVYLVVWASEWQPPARHSASRGWRDRAELRRWSLPFAAAAVVALSSVYYAVFAALLLVGVGAVAAMHRGDARRLVAPLVVAVALAALTGLSLLPDLLDRRDDPAAAAVQRGVAQSETYGLRPAQMVLPRDDHPVAPFAALGERGQRTVAPADRGAVIGLVGVAGLLGMAVVVLRTRTTREDGADTDPTDRTVRVLAATTGVSLLLATAGGGGFVLAVFGLTQVRSWSRLVAVVAFCSLAALALLAQRRAAASGRFHLAVAAVALLALVDQGAWVPTSSGNEALFDEDRALADQLAAVDRGDVLVTQLPVLPYPDQVGYHRMLAPSVLAEERIRFTAGGFAGGGADWQRSWLADDAELAARAAAVAGSEVLLLARDHELLGDVEELESRLGSVTGVEPQRSSRGSWSWFDLRPLRARLADQHGEAALRRAGAGVLRPIGVTYEGERNIEVSGHDLVRDFGPTGSVVLHGDGDDDAVQMRLRVRTQPGAALTVDAAGDVTRATADTDGWATVDLRLQPVGRAETRIRLSTDGGSIGTVNGRQVHLRVDRVQVRDAAASQSPLFAGMSGTER